MTWFVCDHRLGNVQRLLDGRIRGQLPPGGVFTGIYVISQGQSDCRCCCLVPDLLMWRRGPTAHFQQTIGCSEKTRGLLVAPKYAGEVGNSRQ